MFDRIIVPTLIIRGGEDDWNHPKRTSIEVNCLVKGIGADRSTLAGGRVGTRSAGASTGQAVQHVRHVGTGHPVDRRLSRPHVERELARRPPAARSRYSADDAVVI
jgi:hypothetical protein